MNAQPSPPPGMQDVIDEFAWAEGQEKLDLLLEYSRKLAPLPQRFHDQRDRMEKVHECMTPVFVIAETDDSSIHFYFDIPPEAPTVRGFAGLLSAALTGATPTQVLAVPADFWEATGLQTVLTPQRLNGVHAMLAYLKRLAATELARAG